MSNTTTLRRLALPVLVLLTTALSGLVLFAGGSSGAADTTTTAVIAADTPEQANADAALISPAPTSENRSTGTKVAYQTSVPNAGTPNSDIRVFKDGKLVSYGNSDITYWTPSSDRIPLGQALYQQNCASCHGNKADGVPANGTDGAYPNLRGLGPATIDFWIESGRMPAANPREVQAVRKPPRLTHDQALAVVAYVNSLSPATPFIPRVNRLADANRADGFALFALNCAACHTITGGGDALANNTYAPGLRKIPSTQVAEAIRTGPGNMPRFTGNLNDEQVRNLVAYVTADIQHPTNPGGFGLGGLGPVAEGFVALLLGVGILALIGFWIGDRT
jgi:ubiquinol-cytochrome c reductase cytochrome c subunit